jgi:alkanesulfonate monooxygenase SsuD/methylene tetrahydromethanopterin reductase-like flavin-dependent oxidoreductase (luciferase family)
MKIGILFPSRFDEPGEFLADARAMEAAGADSVWLEEDGDSPDPLLCLAAIAAVTGSLRLGLILAPNTHADANYDRRITTLQHLSRQRLITPGAERWRRVEVPADRDAWATTLQQAGPEVDGVLVPLDPRLLDILRHPEDVIDRSDLLLASG